MMDNTKYIQYLTLSVLSVIFTIGVLIVIAFDGMN